MDEAIDTMYRGEERMSILLKIFTVVAMIIASLGLFALASVWFIAILTVLYHAFRSARTNPVLALRYE